MAIKLSDSRFMFGQFTVHQGVKYVSRFIIGLCSVFLCCTIIAICFLITNKYESEMNQHFVDLSHVLPFLIAAIWFEVSGVFTSFYLMQAYRDRRSSGYWPFLIWMLCTGFFIGAVSIYLAVQFVYSPRTTSDTVLIVSSLIGLLLLSCVLIYCERIVNNSRKVLKLTEKRLRSASIASVSARVFE
ncbi:hypothetical protein M3Y97_01135400 [Aphelenchoides bicaudatus]|nr:hypothetical protein M3Y97_01135400 [Aphelenchoides bicaudatus]